MRPKPGFGRSAAFVPILICIGIRSQEADEGGTVICENEFRRMNPLCFLLMMLSPVSLFSGNVSSKVLLDWEETAAQVLRSYSAWLVLLVLRQRSPRALLVVDVRLFAIENLGEGWVGKRRRCASWRAAPGPAAVRFRARAPRCGRADTASHSISPNLRCSASSSAKRPVGALRSGALNLFGDVVVERL